MQRHILASLPEALFSIKRVVVSPVDPRVARRRFRVCRVAQVALGAFTNSGLTSVVLWTWLFNAAQRSCIAPPLVLLANCTRFWLNLSFSIFSSFSFLFIAPGRLFKLLRCILACPVSTWPSAPASSRPESASASDSRFATSFLFGRRRF
jgi:hypothetical protein